MATIRKVDFRPVVNEDAVRILKKMLTKAENGEVTSVAIAATRRDRASCHYYSSTTDFQGLVCAVSVLQHALIADRDRDDTDD